MKQFISIDNAALVLQLQKITFHKSVAVQIVEASIYNVGHRSWFLTKIVRGALTKSCVVLGNLRVCVSVPAARFVKQIAKWVWMAICAQLE